MKIKTFLIVRDYDKNGKLLKEQKKECHSLVQAFIPILSTTFRNANTNAVPNIAGVNQNVTAGSYPMSTNAIIGALDAGIIAGTGVTAVNITDHKIETIINHGNAAGQLSYSAVDYPNTWTVTATQAYVDVRRFLTNNSGGDITIEEFALYVKNTGAISWCIDRTLFSTTVLNGNNKEVVYRFIITV